MSISAYREFKNPRCDGCGAHLPSEKTRKRCEAAMAAAGWIRTDGRDLCRMCQKKEETKRVHDG